MKTQTCFLTREQSLALRGIGALMVIASHYAPWYADLIRNDAAVYVLSRLGVYGVNLFFLISGYGLNKSIRRKKPGARFWKNRMIHFYFPYLLIVGVIELSAQGLRTAESWYQYLTGYNYWYIRNAILFYLLVFIAGRLTQNRLVQTTLLCVGTFLYSWLLVKAGRADFWYLSNLSFVLGFAAGAYEKELLSRLKRRYLLWLLLLGAGVILTVGIGLKTRLAVLTDSDKIVYGVTASAVWTSFALLFAAYLPKAAHVLRFLGKLSLELYLSHMFIFYQIFNQAPGRAPVQKGAAAFLLTVAVSWLLNLAFTYVCRFWREPEKRETEHG